MPAEELGSRVGELAPCSCSHNERLLQPKEKEDSRDGSVTLHAVEQDIQPGTYMHGSRTALGVRSIHDAQCRLHGAVCNTSLK